MKAIRAAAVVAGAVGLCIAGVGPAAAADDTPYVLSTSVNGAWGKIEFGFISSTKVAPIYVQVEDTANDGKHARMRVWASTGEGGKYYAWRSAVGHGNVTKATTDLYDSSGVNAVRIQVCRYAGDTQEQCVISGAISNPWN